MRKVLGLAAGIHLTYNLNEAAGLSHSANGVKSSLNPSYLDSLLPTSSESFQKEVEGKGGDISMADVMARTPDNHYAKNHPGAGWAGYKHPLYGGYLDYLSPSSEPFSGSSTATDEDKIVEHNHHDNTKPTTTDANASSTSYLDALHENAWEAGRSADYGDDVRWGAQVYLDAL